MPTTIYAYFHAPFKQPTPPWRSFPQKVGSYLRFPVDKLSPQVSNSKEEVQVKSVQSKKKVTDSKVAESKRAVEEMKERLRSAVLAERRASVDQITALYTDETTEQLQINGQILINLCLSMDGSLFRNKKFRLSMDNTELPRHKFKDGDPVILSMYSSVGDADKEMDYNTRGFPCTILSITRNDVIIVLDEDMPAQLQESDLTASRWRIDKGSPDATLKRQLKAINSIGENPSNLYRAAIQAFVIGLDYPPSLVQDKIPAWVQNEQWRKQSGLRLKNLVNLNESQRLAIAFSQKQLLTLWQGPPGSGKTWTLLSLIDVVCHANRAVPEVSTGPLLVCADTNTAVNNLVEGLVEKKINVVRIGPPAKAREGLRHVTLDARAQATRLGSIALVKQTQADSLEELAHKEQNPSERYALFQGARQLRSESDKLLDQASLDVIGDCEVVACTCSKSGDDILSGFNFRMVIVDEASQCTEPSILVPLSKGVECLILAGDPQQLPPTVISQEGVQAGLMITLFDRFIQRGLEPRLLDTQYRMHPEICRFASDRFYNGKLKSGVKKEDRPFPKGIYWPNKKSPILFVLCSGNESTMKNGKSSSTLMNRNEANIVMRLLLHVLKPGDVLSVGILTPYSGQVSVLERMLSECKEDLRSASICVSSVDGYQGQEADVIIFSTVRSNPNNTLGFVSDARRLNVAITRAKRGLVVVGNPDTLETSSDWSAWLDRVREEKCYVRASSIPPVH